MTGRELQDEPTCSIERSLQVLGERWTLLILREVFGGRHRFSEMRANLDIAPNLLSTRLRTLVEAGVLETRSYQEPGARPRDSYHLTESGTELRLILAALQQWGDRHRPRPSGPTALRRTRDDDRPVHVAFQDENGNEVPITDVTFVWNPAAGPRPAPKGTRVSR
ncbi:DNA-binding HxlR family transcriptional regulator [Crossiella equi]|uniref:DNA-binding HxlR family transcriptional regulator n=1 Tax=Crossiella equi TaxID=130796 RepID=A0ABS5APF6_9PSEU|nr:helix-turn-helix domain-containing protein [Crossiella equi]MBP2478463.1 DNA-binding HxlR family transcriptional regulator [Crossiella equi]